MTVLQSLIEAKRDALTRADMIMASCKAQNRDLKPAEDADLQRILTEVDDLDSRIKHESELEGRARLVDPVRGRYAGVLNDAPQASRYPATRALFMNTSYGAEWGFTPSDELRSITTTSGGTALYTIGFDSEFHAAVARESVLLNTTPGPRVYTTDTTEFRLAASTAIASASWVAEGGTASPADEGLSGVRIIPDKLMRYQIVSNEALEDANFDVLEPIAAEMFRSFALAVDGAAYSSAGNSANISGLLGQAGAGTANNGTAAVTSFDPFVSTMGSAIAAGNNLGGLVWASGAAVWQHLGKVHIGGTANDVRPLLQTNVNQGGAALAGEILGRPYYVTSSSGMAGGSAAKVLLYDPRELAVVFSRRFSVVFDSTTRADSDETRVIATMRVGVKPIHSAAIALLDGIDTTS